MVQRVSVTHPPALVRTPLNRGSEEKKWPRDAKQGADSLRKVGEKL